MEKLQKKLTIAIDGFSSCGKSTAAKDLAKELSYSYIDSGAMYRAVTLFCMQKKLINGTSIDINTLKKEINSIKIHFTYDKENEKHLTWLNNNLVEKEIRTIEVSDKVSLVSKIDFVRERMVALQQNLGKNGGIVMDGRDIGTVVFPNADIKIFMTASVKIRAERRFKELKSKGDNVLLEDVMQNIEKRDYIDQNREISPLKKANDAFELDNSNLSRKEQLQKILDLVKKEQ